MNTTYERMKIIYIYIYIYICANCIRALQSQLQSSYQRAKINLRFYFMTKKPDEVLCQNYRHHGETFFKSVTLMT